MVDYKELVSGLSKHIKDFSAKAAEREKLKQHALDGVVEYYRQVDFYSQCAQKTAPFLDELSHCLHGLKHAINECDEGLIFDRCFQAVEVLCVIMREKSLVTGKETNVEERIFTFFENSPHWVSTDKTLVAELYHTILPELYSAR